MDKDPLESFFEAARADAPQPSGALMARILADADRESEARSAAARLVEPSPGRLRAVLAALGGWPVLAGLATATMAGVWIGVAQPMGVDPLEVVGGTASLDAGIYPGYAALDWGEG